MNTDNMTFEDYPKAMFMPAGNTSVNLILGNEHKLITKNVQKAVEAIKEYKKAYDNACSIASDDPYFHDNHFVCTESFSDCVCLRDAYENLLSTIDPYERWNLEGILDKDSNGNFFLGNLRTPISDTMAELIIEFQENDLDPQPLVNFHKLSLLNPDDRAREDLLDYITEYGITITDEGYMLLYKRVNTKKVADPDEDLVAFVSTEYVKRKGWGKNPDDYYVYDLDEEITLPNNHTAGPGYYVSTMMQIDLGEFDYKLPLNTLQELYDNLEDLKGDTSTTIYTDWYSGTFNYEIGETHKMPREDCNPDPSVGCSKGLHVGSYDYVHMFGLETEPIQACLVSPEDVVAIPEHDNSKIRTCRFHSLGLMDTTEDVWKLDTVHIQESFTEYDKEELHDRILDLEDQLGDVEDDEADYIEDQLDVLESRLVEL